MATTFSCSTAFCSAASAPGFEDWLSMIRRSIFFPFTPPAALISLRASLIDLTWRAPPAACTPVIGGVNPIRISSPAVATPLPKIAAIMTDKKATDKMRRTFVILPSLFPFDKAR